MAWLLFLFSVFPAHASAYDRDELKIHICEELHAFMREMPVETCFRAHFKFRRREDGVDYRWWLNKKLFCTGTVYADNGDIQIDGCYP